MIEVCQTHSIDLLIPGTDDEAHIISRQIKKFETVGVRVIVAEEAIFNVIRDKEKMSNELNKITDIFVKSYSRAGFRDALKKGEVYYPVIAKPRSGFASRNIEIINSEEDIVKITDNHIVQEIAVPHKNDPERDFYEAQLRKNINPQVAELSIQIVANQQGEIIGRMMSYNKLNNGVPIEIIPFENEYIWREVENLYPELKKLGIKGPLNLQGRLTDKGLKLFEMNARFTGITGLRALMGFNEVEACIKEWLEIRPNINNIQVNRRRFGIRQTTDKSIMLSRNRRVQDSYQRINSNTLYTKPRLLITGATGYLGRNLIDSLYLKDGSFEIWALIRDKKKAESLLPPEVKFFDKEDLLNGTLSMGNVDMILHAAFSRPHHSEKDIADSLAFTAELFRIAIFNQVPDIVNISSQSIYGTTSIPPWTEETAISPETVYGSAKYGAELLLGNLARFHKHIHYTSLRLGALTGGAKGLVEIDVLSKLVKKAMNTDTIRLTGGKQMIERLDIRDAVNGIIELMKSPSSNWKPVYNLGASHPIQLIDLTKLVVEVVSKEMNISKSLIEIEHKKSNQHFGLNSQSFYSDFNWKPQHSLTSSISSLINYFKTIYPDNQ
ncbi:MAG: NAD-dependent epimerase/dehydratase family protein [Chitinophagaceae bacterium]